MSAPFGFTESDAERQAANSVANYLSRALRMLGVATGLEKTLEWHPDCFADRFAPLLAALVEAQAREYQSWVLYERIGGVAAANRDALGDLATVFSERLQSLDESLLSGIADIAERLEEGNAGTCRACARKTGAANYRAKRL